MRIQAGYDHQNFIANLATSENLTKLGCLDYTDVFNLVNGDCTSFDDYKRLFESDFFSHYEHFHFTLRDPRLTPEQLQQLAAIKKIQLLHIDPSMGDYIRPD